MLHHLVTLYHAWLQICVRMYMQPNKCLALRVSTTKVTIANHNEQYKQLSYIRQVHDSISQLSSKLKMLSTSQLVFGLCLLQLHNFFYKWVTSD